MSQIDCPRCGTRYVDPSPAAMLEPRPCPQCKANPPSVVETVVAAREAKIRELETQLLALKETVRGYLAVDGSEGAFNAVKRWEMRKKLKALVGP